MPEFCAGNPGDAVRAHYKTGLWQHNQVFWRACMGSTGSIPELL